MDIDSFPSFAHANRRLLNRSVSLLKVKVFQIGAHKAPSLNGLLSMFSLEIFGYHQKLCVAIHSTSFLYRKLSGADESYSIALIPKQDASKLISLCNMVVKIVTKIIANSLKP